MVIVLEPFAYLWRKAALFVSFLGDSGGPCKKKAPLSNPSIVLVYITFQFTRQQARGPYLIFRHFHISSSFKTLQLSDCAKAMATTLKLNIPSIAPRNSVGFTRALKVCLAAVLYNVPVQYSKGRHLLRGSVLRVHS